MLFQSFVFVRFFLLFYVIYLLLARNLKAQNLLLLIASYIFYGFWDWRFLSLLWLSTIIDFFVGKFLAQTEDIKRRKLLLAISVVSNLSILGFFKYFNFFAASLINLFNLVGLQADTITLNILLPVGISFYTFQTLSYTIDIYRRKLEPAKNLLDFGVYIAFFPQLVAGPIERASNLIPQVTAPRKIKAGQVNAGLFLILWGYFKKIVVADNAALIANQVFNNYRDYQGLDLIIGTLAFTLQIYGDFSGYSDIARGLAKLMGFELMVNFNLPYFAINPSDFWSRWHISLSSWLRDYLYLPLGGNRHGKFNTYRNLTLTMLLGGLWHGAAWNFVLWGGFHSLLLVVYRFFELQFNKISLWPKKLSSLYVLVQMLLMLIFTNIGWIIFRSSSLEQISYFLTNLGFTPSDKSFYFWKDLFLIAFPLLVMQICQYFSGDLLIVTKFQFWLRVPIYSFLVIWLIVFGVRESVEFIYFQF